jgi:hypothetical protein
LTELKPISVSPDFRKQPCDTVSFTSLTDGTPECDIVQKWAKAVSLPSIEAFQFVGPILPPFMPVLEMSVVGQDRPFDSRSNISAPTPTADVGPH